VCGDGGGVYGESDGEVSEGGGCGA
jgi:hypothetical protein